MNTTKFKIRTFCLTFPLTLIFYNRKVRTILRYSNFVVALLYSSFSLPPQTDARSFEVQIISGTYFSFSRPLGSEPLLQIVLQVNIFCSSKVILRRNSCNAAILIVLLLYDIIESCTNLGQFKDRLGHLDNWFAEWQRRMKATFIVIVGSFVIL